MNEFEEDGNGNATIRVKHKFKPFESDSHPKNRMNIAAMAMQSEILADINGGFTYSDIAVRSVEAADALLKELNK